MFGGSTRSSAASNTGSSYCIGNYKPFATRTPVLIFLLLVTLALLGLTEYACHVVYAHSGAGSSYSNLENGLGLHARLLVEPRSTSSETGTSAVPQPNYSPTPVPNPASPTGPSESAPRQNSPTPSATTRGGPTGPSESLPKQNAPTSTLIPGGGNDPPYTVPVQQSSGTLTPGSGNDPPYTVPGQQSTGTLNPGAGNDPPYTVLPTLTVGTGNDPPYTVPPQQPTGTLIPGGSTDPPYTIPSEQTTIGTLYPGNGNDPPYTVPPTLTVGNGNDPPYTVPSQQPTGTLIPGGGNDPPYSVPPTLTVANGNDPPYTVLSKQSDTTIIPEALTVDNGSNPPYTVPPNQATGTLTPGGGNDPPYTIPSEQTTIGTLYPGKANDPPYTVPPTLTAGNGNDPPYTVPPTLNAGSPSDPAYSVLAPTIKPSALPAGNAADPPYKVVVDVPSTIIQPGGATIVLSSVPVVNTGILINIDKSTYVVLSAVETTPWLPEITRVVSTVVSYNSEGQPVTSLSTMDITTYVPRPMQSILTLTSVRTNRQTSDYLTTNYKLTSTTITPSRTKGLDNMPSETIYLQPTATIVNASGVFLLLPDGNTAIPRQILLWEYVLVAWLPLIVAIIFSIPWRIVDNTIREMEPFYQLHHPDGALAERSICLDFATMWFVRTPVAALRSGHYFVFSSSLIYFFVLLLAPLASETFVISLAGDCAYDSDGSKCRATWGIYPLLARTLEAILGLIAVAVILIIIFGFRRHSGVYSDPLSIGGLATLLQNPSIQRDFRGIDSMISNKRLHRELNGARFSLGMSIGPDQEPCYGITMIGGTMEKASVSNSVMASNENFRGSYAPLKIPAIEVTEADVTDHHQESIMGPSDDEEDDALRSSMTPAYNEHKKNGHYVSVHIDELGPNGDRASLASSNLSEVSRRSWIVILERTIYFAAFFLFSSLLTMILYSNWAPHDNGFRRFTESAGFGVRFLMTTLGVLAKLFWGHIDEDFRRLEPYRRLVKGSSEPEDSILVPIWVSPWTAVFPAIRRGHFLVGFISFIAILSEFLPIILANSLSSNYVTDAAQKTCLVITSLILITMLACILVLVFRPASAIRNLPRQPDNVASVMRYIISPERKDGLSMLDSFQGLAMASGKERDTVIRRMKRRYELGWVDEGELCINDHNAIRRSWT